MSAQEHLAAIRTALTHLPHCHKEEQRRMWERGIERAVEGLEKECATVRQQTLAGAAAALRQRAKHYGADDGTSEAWARAETLADAADWIESITL